MFTCKPYEVDSDMPIFPSSEDEPVVLEHFFVEPGCREDWVSGLLDLDALQIEKCFNIEDITGTFDYDLTKLDKDSVHPKCTEGGVKSPEVSYDTSQGISTRVSEQNHSDAKHTDEAKNASNGHCKIESGDKMIEISSKRVSVIKSSMTQQYSLLGQAEGEDADGAFKDMSELETFEIDKNWPEKHDLNCLESYELDSSLNLTKYEVFSDENEDKTTFSSVEDYSGRSSGSVDGTQKHQNMSRDRQSKRKRVDGFESLMVSTSDAVDEEDKTGKIVSPKRSRKPPRRYIEESLEYELKPFAKKCGMGKKSKDRLMQPKWQKEFLSEQVGFEDDSFNVGCIQVPFGLPLEKEHSKKSKSSPVRSYEDPKESRVLDPCDKVDIEPLSVESQEDFSEDECVTTRSYTPKGNNSRRKRHISWTQEEVVKLVDGIAQCGVGRWTEIKRLLFSSSSHRTSVDLKDKWRNLLRASCSQLQIKEKVDHGRKQSGNYVSDSILWRVRELAVLYPYPRDNRAKVSCTGPAVSSFSVPLSTVV